MKSVRRSDFDVTNTVQVSVPAAVLDAVEALQVVGDALSQFGHDSRVDLACLLGQCALGRSRVGGGDTAGQHVDRSAYRSDVFVADSAGLDGRCQVRQFGW